MRPRLVMFTALIIAAAAVAAAVSHISTMHHRAHKVVHASLPVSLASYLGVFEAGSPPSYQPIAEFAAAANRRPDILGLFSGWAQPFDSTFASTLWQHHIIPFVQIDPTFASMSAITAGDYDTYLKAYANSVVDFGHPVIIGFAHEMNAPWYPWGYGRLPPSGFVAAWRHIVTLFRSQGAENVTWLWTINSDRPGTGPVADWWPGKQYVTWVGIDGYYFRPADTFKSVFGKTIDQLRAFTHDPILLSETAVGPRAGQLLKIQDLFHGMAQYKTLGLVWFDKAQDKGIFQQDWRIEDSQTAEDSFRLGIRDELTPLRQP
jgi:mannan endo-1,4-beta-mannosidase